MVQLEPEIQKKLDAIAEGPAAAHAAAVDRDGVFPTAAMDAIAASGLSGLISAPEVGGLGQGPGGIL